ncbi:hypothetical protein FQR65_LT09009 [Abscondita terminalis]|nr:hypothetical protein FQR65_LT09009 [Abscondita terminalis]
MQFAGKVILVTGASSGIGAATAQRFAALGANLALHGRNLDNLNKVASECVSGNKQKPLLLTGEFTKESDIKSIFDSVIQHYGKLDVLVNNAGILESGSIETTSLEQYDRLMNTNVRSVYYLTMLAVPYLIASKGNIVNVSSVNGIRSFPNVLAYCMSKACIDQFTRCTALELASKEVRVNCVNPGVIITSIHQRSGMNEEQYQQFLARTKTTHALGRPGLASEVASTITFLASNDASNITGVSIPQEIIQLHVGRAGVQIASSCWELYCLEHGIQPDGYQYESRTIEDGCFNSFFDIFPGGKCVPRLLMVDFEPTVIDLIRTGHYRYLFDAEQLISGKEDAGNNYARGKYMLGSEMIDLALDRIRKLVEGCNDLQGFILFRASGGGTGSGFGTLLLEELYVEYRKKSKIEFAIYPDSHISPVIVEPYNAVLTTHESLDYEDLCFVMDNEAAYDILTKTLNLCRPTYTNLNNVLAQVISSVNSSLRFEGAVNVRLIEFPLNLVPYPRIHFPLISYAPFASSLKAFHEQMTVSELTNTCFDHPNHLIKIDPQLGSIYLVVYYIEVGLNFNPPVVSPIGDLALVNRTITILSNNSAIKDAWKNLNDKCNMMYKKKAFIHQYVEEGMEEDEFKEARENLQLYI